MKKILIIAGPNGAGKTTFAEEFLPREAECPVFFNADLIARGLSPFLPEAAAFTAGRVLLQQIDRAALRGESFAFETTLSGKVYLERIQRWRMDGYYVELLFLQLPNVDFAIRRVAQRVAEGGHGVSPSDIERRFRRGLDLLKKGYQPIVDSWTTYDASTSPPTILEESANHE